MSRFKQIIRITAVSASVIAICTVFYMNAENFVSYDLKSSQTVSETTAENSMSGINSNPENIPYSIGYDMYLKNGYLFVFNSESVPVYRSKTNIISGFTEKDIEQLERNGIHYFARSELIEILNYIGS